MFNNESRKIILDLAVTLDGYIEGPNGEIDWCIMEPDMKFTDFLNDIDTILYGRKSYDLWGQYIPQSEVSDDEKEMWKLLSTKKKYVFSKTLTEVDGDAILLNKNLEDEVKKIKKEQGKNIWLYGGSSIITTFINLGLVDEYRLSIHPIILGSGKPLFVDINERKGFELTDVKRFSSGVVQLCYQSRKK
jgi:dihydrofolate reductase